MVIKINYTDLGDYGFEREMLLDDNWEDLLDVIINYLWGRYQYDSDVDVYDISDDYIEVDVDDDFDKYGNDNEYNDEDE